MKSTRSKTYLNESLAIEMSGAFGVTQQDAIAAFEIAENDMLVGECDRHRSDLRLLEDMLEKLVGGTIGYHRQHIVDWRDELERKIAWLKREINA